MTQEQQSEKRCHETAPISIFCEPQIERSVNLKLEKIYADSQVTTQEGKRQKNSHSGKIIFEKRKNEIKVESVVDGMPEAVAVKEDSKTAIKTEKTKPLPTTGDLNAAESYTIIKSENTTSDDKSSRLPKRKVALLISYCGSGYHGMQINPNVPSIELDLHKALAMAKAVGADNIMQPNKISFIRCARTDKVYLI